MSEASVATADQASATEVQTGPANAAFPVVHPDVPELNHIYGTIIDGAPRHAGSTQANCCIFADRQVDRSPTGSGTAGRVAQLYQRGRLALGRFARQRVGHRLCIQWPRARRNHGRAYPAVIPEVRGNAQIYGFASWIINEKDPLTYGFLVR
ncbi:proline racemase family protein [Pseudomonas cavernicola]|uniref:proline racemase family protein n=1 Tax=Pseudomonas cavernicola TaxID=2320866 RepID=UPI001EE5192C|nr:proline racemase family protein [Pseudomonas cavernicola]